MTAQPERPPRRTRPRTKPCGTHAAARAHMRDGIPRADLDPDCANALREYEAEAQRRRRGKATR